MALLSKRERDAIKLALRDPHLTDQQRGSLERELKADDESVSEGSHDAKYAVERRP